MLVGLSDLPLLSLEIFIPIIGAIVVGACAHCGQRYLSAWIGRVTALLTIGLLVPLVASFKPEFAGMQFVESYDWIPELNARYALGIDGISLVLIGLTVVISAMVIFSSANFVKDRMPSYMAVFLLLQSFMVGVFAVTDILLFYIFWEAMLIPMFIAIGVWGSKRGTFAAIKFFIFTFLGSALLLVGIIYLGIKAGSFAYIDLYDLQLSMPVQKLLFGVFWLAFAVKVPMWPVHTWLPDAHTEAPTAGSVILAALMLKVGAYGFLRLSLPILPDAARALAWPMIVLSLVAVVYIGCVVLVQRDMKRLIAYSSIAHMGFVTLGMFSIYLVGQSELTSATAQFVVSGAIMQMISHGFSSGGLFLGFGYLYNRVHTREIADFGGITKVMPWFSFLFMIFVFANVGLPGTSGFVGEFMIIIGLIKLNFVIAAIAGLTLILAAAYTLNMVRKVFFGPLVNKKLETLVDISPVDYIGILGVILIIIGLGLGYNNLIYLVISLVGAMLLWFNYYKISRKGERELQMEFLWMGLLGIAILSLGFMPQILFKYIGPGVTNLLPLVLGSKLIG